MKKKKHAEHENLERWLISYADFITLMFAFFVVMWSMRTDNPPSKPVIEGIKRAFNAFGEKSSAQETIVAIQAVGASQAIFTVEPMYQSIVDAMKKSGVKGVSVHKVDRGVVIRIPDEALFQPGEAVISENFKATLYKTGTILKDMPNNFQIEGHTDNIPIKTSNYPSNWELSVARATAIMHYLVDVVGLPPQRFAVAGYSEYQPIASNDTLEGRSKNRRVDIVVVKEQKPNKSVPSAGVSPGIDTTPTAPSVTKASIDPAKPHL